MSEIGSNLLNFPKERRVDIAMANCARVYERARAMGVWQRSRQVRDIWMELLGLMLRKANS